MSDRAFTPQTSDFEYIEVAEGLWYRRGPACFTCQDQSIQGVIFTPSDAAAPFEACATCSCEIDVSQYGERETGKVRILFPPEKDDVEGNPYLNPLPAVHEKNWKKAFVDTGLHDIGNGRRLALMFGERIRYTAGWGWLVYDGRRWLRDDRGTMDRFAKATVEEMRNLLQEPLFGKEFETDKKEFSRHAFATSSRGKVDAMLAMAASESNVATGVEQFDQYPWLLNCRNGIVDLSTGQLRPHDPGLYLTQLLPHEYDPDASCPRWLQFIDEITCGDKQLADYLHRAVGYTITGDVKEEKVFFMYGGGANGKSKFIGALRHVLGDYGTSLSFEALLKSRNTTPEQGFAHLPGKRFATASEASGNRSWNEEALKAITGRDTIRGKQLYKDQFEFRAVCKIWVAANDQPRVEDYGDAMWRRFAIIPFQAHFEGSNKDPDLEAKLEAEAKGILAWAVRGAMRWYRQGLNPEPDVMRRALEEYKSDQDTLGRWIAECCVLGPTHTCSAKDLYASYKQYAKDNGERELTQTAFGGALAKWKNGRLKKDRGTGGRVRWNGIMTASQFEIEDQGFTAGSLGSYDRPSPPFD